MKFDASGNEIWFNRLLGSYVNVYGLESSPLSTAIFLCGDFSGTLNYKNTSNHYVSSTYLKKTFLLKTDQSGVFQWGKTLGSENDISCRDLMVDASDNVTVTGYFKCDLTELRQMYGKSLFNSVGFKDIYLAKYNSSGSVQWHYQLGGPQEDIPYSVFNDLTGNALLVGSFEDNINIPVENGFYVTNSTNDLAIPPLGPNYGLDVCGSLSYGSFVSSNSAGHKDIFLTLPFNPNRPLYDYYARTDSICDYDTLMPYITQDTIIDCDNATATIYLPTGANSAIGPGYEFNWSNSTTGQTMFTTTTGWYDVYFSFEDGCRNFYDSVYINILSSYGSPIIEASSGFIADAIPVGGCESKVSLFDSTAFLFVTNAPPGYEVIWLTPTGSTIVNDSVPANEAGVYYASILDSVTLCQTSSCIEINFIIAGVCSGHGVDDIYEIHFTDSLPDAIDTIIVCERAHFEMYLIDSSYFAAGITSMYFPLFVNWQLTGGYEFDYPYSAPLTFGTHVQNFKANFTSNCTVQASLINPVNGLPFQTISRNFYLIVIEDPTDNLSLVGPDFICPNDTIQLVASGISGITWNGTGTFSVVDDTIANVTTTGVYSVYASFVDTMYSCNFANTVFHPVQAVPQPQINLVPTTGVICPLDSVLLIGDGSGNDFTWIGPLGNTNDSTYSIYSSVPGFYYYSYIDTNGCPLVSETVELNEYSTPSIMSDPGLLICSGEEVMLEVDAVDGSIVIWDLPFTDSSLIQFVDTPGIYTCTIISCGITTFLSVNIANTSVNANILYSGSTIVCPTDSITLFASGGAFEYSWSDGSVSPVLETLGGGVYILTATDESGCTATDTLLINEASAMVAPSSVDTTVCLGSSITVNVTGAGTISWFTDPSFTAVFIGNSLSIPQVDSSMSFILQSTDTVCASDYAFVNILINPSSVTPQIIGDNILCVGEALFLSAPGIADVNYYWSGPGGYTTNTSTVSIPSSSSNVSGWYYLYVQDSSCTSENDSIYINWNYSLTISLNETGVYELCMNDTLALTFNPDLVSFEWSNGNSIDTLLQITNAGAYFIIGTDSSGCFDTSATVTVVLNPLPNPPAITDTSTCVGGTITFANPSGNNWYLSSDSLVHTGTSDFIVIANSGGNIYYVASESADGCLSEYDTVSVSILPNLPAPIVDLLDTSVCIGSDVTFNAFTTPYMASSISWQFDGSNINSTSTLNLNNVIDADEGLYYVQYSVGPCNSFMTEVSLEVISPDPFDLNSDTVLCDGHFINYFYENTSQQSYTWSVSNSSSLLVTQPGIYFLTATTPEGCFITDSIIITGEDCGSTQINVITPNGDGVNDFLSFDKFTMPLKEIIVYDRWGVLINKVSPPLNGWNGKDMSGEYVVEGVYYYIAITFDSTNSENIITGFVHVFY